MKLTFKFLNVGGSLFIANKVCLRLSCGVAPRLESAFLRSIYVGIDALLPHPQSFII